jgi:hypothetical protein
MMLPFAASGDDAAFPAYRSTASEVRITFFATDEANHPINNLSKDDFAVVDGDLIVRNFRSLARSQETTLDVVIDRRFQRIGCLSPGNDD